MQVACHQFYISQRYLELMEKYIINSKRCIKKSRNSPRVTVTMGPTYSSKGPIPCSGAWAWGVRHICQITEQISNGKIFTIYTF